MFTRSPTRPATRCIPGMPRARRIFRPITIRSSSAEVASTFNEILLTEHLLKNTDDRRMKAYIINRQIDDLRGTLYRQTMFAEFEKAAHAAEEAGEALTLDTFKAIYRGLLDVYFGPNFAVDKELELECLRIPHFYGAFYVYKYATGISAAAALAEQVLAGGDVNRYLSFLRSGGSKFPIETLAEAGVDMSSPAPVAAALALFERRVGSWRNCWGNSMETKNQRAGGETAALRPNTAGRGGKGKEERGEERERRGTGSKRGGEKRGGRTTERGREERGKKQRERSRAEAKEIGRITQREGGQYKGEAALPRGRGGRPCRPPSPSNHEHSPKPGKPQSWQPF